MGFIEPLKRLIKKTDYDEESAHIERSVIPEVDSELRVSYVIPIKGEISNGNFFNQLKDLASKTAICSRSKAVNLVCFFPIRIFYPQV